MSDNLESIISAAVAAEKEAIGDTSNTNDVEPDAVDTAGQPLDHEPIAESDALIIPETETNVSDEAKAKIDENTPESLSPEAKVAKDALDAETKKKADEDKELGPAVDKRGRENRIPYSAVKRISANAEKRGEDRARATYEPQLTEKTGLVTEYEKRLTAIEHVERVMFEEPEQFVELLPAIHPAYAALLQQRAVTAPVTQPIAVPNERPRPDYEFSPGKWTYSPEGLDKLVAWNTAQTEQRILEKVQPLTDAFEGSKRMQQHAANVTARVDEASRNWKGFAENSEAILGILRSNKQLTLEGAYRVWRDKAHADELSKATADREKLRAELLAEIKAAPVSTSTAPAARKQTASPVADADPIDAAIRNAIRASKST